MTPLGEGCKTPFFERAQRHDKKTQSLLLLLAADGSGRPETIRAAAALLGVTGDSTTSRLLRKAVRQARAVGAASTLAWTLEFLVLDELATGGFSIAEAFAEEGFRLATETGQLNTACRHRTMLAWLAVLQGQGAETKTLADEVLAEASRRRLADSLAYAHLSLGHLELVAGNNVEAVRHYGATQSRDSSGVQSGLAHAQPARSHRSPRPGRPA